MTHFNFCAKIKTMGEILSFEDFENQIRDLRLSQIKNEEKCAREMQTFISKRIYRGTLVKRFYKQVYLELKSQGFEDEEVDKLVTSEFRNYYKMDAWYERNRWFFILLNKTFRKACYAKVKDLDEIVFEKQMSEEDRNYRKKVLEEVYTISEKYYHSLAVKNAILNDAVAACKKLHPNWNYFYFPAKNTTRKFWDFVHNYLKEYDFTKFTLRYTGNETYYQRNREKINNARRGKQIGDKEQWKKASFKYKNKICIYEGKYFRFEQLKRKIGNTEEAKKFLLPDSEQEIRCIYQDKFFELWNVCYLLRNTEADPYKAAKEFIDKENHLWRGY